MKTLEKVDRKDYCEGTRFRPHECKGGIEANHVFYKRNDARSPKQRQYIDDEVNLSYLCQAGHTSFGHTKEFKAWFYKHQCGRHSQLAVDGYLAGWPGRVKERAP